MEGLTNSTRNCPPYTQGNANTVLTVYSIFAAFAVSFYLAAVVLIAKARICESFVHRLTLYMSIGGLVREVAYMLQVLPLETDTPEDNAVSLRNGWYGACAFGGFFIQYTGLVETCTMLWIPVYVFCAVLFEKQLREHKHEIAGVVIVLLVPLLFSWEPFVTGQYGLTDSICWIKDDDGCPGNYDIAFIYQMTTNLVPHFALTLFGLASMMVAVAALLWRKEKQRILQLHYSSAIKDILPLMIYPTLYLTFSLARLLVSAAGAFNWKVNLVFAAAFQSCSVALPLSLLVRYQVRYKLCPKRMREEREYILTSSTPFYAETALT